MERMIDVELQYERPGFHGFATRERISTRQAISWLARWVMALEQRLRMIKTSESSRCGPAPSIRAKTVQTCHKQPVACFPRCKSPPRRLLL